MSKYDGIDRPELEVSQSNTITVRKKPIPSKEGYLKGLLFRIMIAGVILGIIFGIANSNLGFAIQFRDAIYNSITVDFSQGGSISNREYYLWDSIMYRLNRT